VSTVTDTADRSVTVAPPEMLRVRRGGGWSLVLVSLVGGASVGFNKAFASLTADQFIEDVLVKTLRVRHLIIGDDFRFGAKRAGDFALLQQAGDSFGFRVEAMNTVASESVRVSSSAVRDALWVGDLERAAELLGRPYVIDGRVVHGDKVGRQLGYATANIRMKHDRPPLLGVFAVEVTGIDGRALPGVANLGYRPTANAVVRPILEVHLFDFAADIYGAHLTVRFLHKIRDEMKFSGFDELKAQIARAVDRRRYEGEAWLRRSELHAQ